MGEIGLPPCLGDGRDRGFSALPIYIGSHDSCPGPPEGEGQGTTDPCTGTGDDYRLTLEIVLHSTLPQEAVSLALERPRLIARKAGAERTLEAVGCSALFGMVCQLRMRYGPAVVPP